MPFFVGAPNALYSFQFVWLDFVFVGCKYRKNIGLGANLQEIFHKKNREIMATPKEHSTSTQAQHLSYSHLSL